MAHALAVVIAGGGEERPPPAVLLEVLALQAEAVDDLGALEGQFDPHAAGHLPDFDSPEQRRLRSLGHSCQGVPCGRLAD